MVTDWMYIKGQEHVKRAMEVAIAGEHHILMIGPPGQGKTLIARSVPGILPELTEEEEDGIIMTKIDQRPFRSPPLSISDLDLFGSPHYGPGEISFAHSGILFLDDLPEFGRSKLSKITGHMEDNYITASPSFTLLAAMTPCPCGFYGDPEKECICSVEETKAYQKIIPGPFWDRIDVHVEVPRIPFEKLSSKRSGEPSEKVRERIVAARAIQRERFDGTDLRTNSDMGLAEIAKICSLDPPGTALLKAAMIKLGLSARAYHRILELARTIADLSGSNDIKVEHVAEAVQYRPKKLI